LDATWRGLGVGLYQGLIALHGGLDLESVWRPIFDYHPHLIVVVVAVGSIAQTRCGC